MRPRNLTVAHEAAHVVARYLGGTLRHVDLVEVPASGMVIIGANGRGALQCAASGVIYNRRLLQLHNPWRLQHNIGVLVGLGPSGFSLPPWWFRRASGQLKRGMFDRERATVVNRSSGVLKGAAVDKGGRGLCLFWA